METDRFPADATPQKPAPEIGEARASDIRARSFGAVASDRPIWIPSEVDEAHFRKLTRTQPKGDEAA